MRPDPVDLLRVRHNAIERAGFADAFVDRSRRRRLHHAGTVCRWSHKTL
jgi:hypothetical protein